MQCLGTENEPDIELTNELTSVLMEESDMIIATGGAGMVKAAYSSGTPCYGVGQGNVQVLVDEGFTDFDTIAANVLASRTNDAGTNCTGEQTIYVPKDQKENLIKAFEAKGCFCVRGVKVMLKYCSDMRKIRPSDRLPAGHRILLWKKAWKSLGQFFLLRRPMPSS